jgi:hypothetical protein
MINYKKLIVSDEFKILSTIEEMQFDDSIQQFVSNQLNRRIEYYCILNYKISSEGLHYISISLGL